jgi:hypothetical protein
VFYEVGLTEDRDRAEAAPRPGEGDPRPPGPPGPVGEHQAAHSRPPDRQRGHRRRLR